MGTSGWQAMVRVVADGRQALVVTHAFADAPSRVEFALPPGRWRLKGGLAENETPSGRVAEGGWSLDFAGDFSTQMLWLERV